MAFRTVKGSFRSLQYSQAQTPVYSLHSRVCSEESPSGVEKPRRQAFATSSSPMMFRSLPWEREVSWLGKSFILSTMLWGGEGFDRCVATFWILLKEEFLSQATGSPRLRIPELWAGADIFTIFWDFFFFYRGRTEDPGLEGEKSEGKVVAVELKVWLEFEVELTGQGRQCGLTPFI